MSKAEKLEISPIPVSPKEKATVAHLEAIGKEGDDQRINRYLDTAGLPVKLKITGWFVQ